MRDAAQLYASFDIGKPGNNPIFVWRPLPGGAIQLVGYSDQFNQEEAIDWLVESYPESKVKVIYPHDGGNPGTDLGISQVDKSERYVKKKGYEYRIDIDSALNKTKNRVHLVRNGVTMINRVYADVDLCGEGLDKLASVRMVKDNKTGYIKFGKFTNHNSSHTGDAFCYIFAALEEDRVSMKNLQRAQVGRPMQTNYAAEFKRGSV